VPQIDFFLDGQVTKDGEEERRDEIGALHQSPSFIYFLASVTDQIRV
jgi:hypothetical protein